MPTSAVAGIPRTRPAVKTDQMSVVRRYYNTDGTAWKGGALKEGQALIVQLEVESKARMPDALLVDLLPAGLEIENLNLTPAEQWADVSVDGVSLDERGSQANIVHEEYRDDRACAGPSTSPRRAGRGRHRRRGHRWGAHRLTGGSSGSDISAISPSTNPVGFASLSSTSRATSAAADV